MSDGSRTRTGCLTCRIRKKKCDEERPICRACRSRELACYGFDEPAPAWYTSKNSWKDIRNSDEAKGLRTLAETRYKISRKIAIRGDDSSRDNAPPTPSLEDQATSSHDDHRTSPSLYFLESGANIWQLRPESLWWDSTIRSLAPDHGSTSLDDTKLLMMFLEVIHPITHTFYKLDGSKDRGWMLERILASQPLYCSALSISACFDHSLTQTPRVNDIGICSKVRTFQNTALCNVQAEISKFASMPTTPVEEFVWAGVQLLDVAVHLLTLEIFSMLQGSWEMHHQAARGILNHIEICASKYNESTSSSDSVIEATLLSWPHGDTRRRSLEFCICNYVWIDILAISTFGALAYDPCAFDYLNLLQSEIIKPQEIMGCQGWIIAIVLKITRLEQWKVTQQGQTHPNDIAMELARRSTQLADELQFGTDILERDRDPTKPSGLEEDIRLISIIWAYGAQVFRQVTTSAVDSEFHDIDQTYVDICLQKLEALPTRLVMRASWPYTIAGCIASTESQHARFRRIVGRVMEGGQAPGISWKGLMVMEECWRWRRVNVGSKVGWREAMEKLGARVLLT